jgi:NAD(P)-dependent dehydrogenase (short-subunit alcohol dehydrogenase family)
MSQSPVILVTGASRGLGRGIATQLAEAGFSVAINYAGNETAAMDTKAQCEKLAPSSEQEFDIFQADIGKAADRSRMVAEVVDSMQGIDALVNNAGIAPRVRADLTEMSEESYDDVMGINLKGPHFLTQAVVDYWLKQKPACRLNGDFKIVFVSSISAYTASVNRGEYCISKAGLAMVNQLWAARLAAEGVQTVEIRPGIMETDMTSGVKEKYDKLLAEGLVPQKRWGQPGDIGKAVRAFLNNDFPFSTGDVLNIDGGFHLQTL